MRNLIEFLENTCKTKAEYPAAEDGGGVLSFAELRLRALKIGGYVARKLASERNGKAQSGLTKKMIAVCLPKGTECLCAMLGVLYSGNIYVPMDTRAPIKRTKLILETLDPDLIITDAAGRQVLCEEGSADCDIVVEYGEFSPFFTEAYEAADEALTEKTISQTRDVDPAYLLFTSGSTGVPKGVVISHGRVIAYIEWAREHFNITGGETIGNQAPFYFTVSAMDIWLGLATGSKICVIPENLFAKPDKLLQFMDEKKITLIFWVSSVYNHIARADALKGISLKSLKRAWFVGEPISPDAVRYWMEWLPSVEFTNLYGSTETDMTLCYTVPKDYSGEENVPMGYPCANTEIMLLSDDSSAAVNPGEIGEICVRGACLALGYYKDAEKTREKFIQNPAHDDYRDIVYRTGDLAEIRGGLFVFHGRKDNQFKHLGYRVEAGEIEAAAAGFETVRNTCVLYDIKKKQIVLFYEADGQPDEVSYRRALMSDLPVYMVPTRFVRLDAIPLNANGKKDRILLKELYIEREMT